MSNPANSVRLGLVGLGFAAVYAEHLRAGKVSRATLAAVVSRDPARLARVPEAVPFASAEAMIASGLVDAVIIATPHYAHTTIGIAALQAGLHVLVEKPISAHLADAQRLLAAHTDPRLIFAAMFNQRTDPFYQKIRALIRDGELGEIRRVAWTVTDWFRPASYYAASDWRATWAGDGGGVLLNQCSHNLDLMHWLFGMPVRVRAFCRFGHHHPIEAEDEVTAYLEFPNGASAVFTTSTGEAPGTNRLEIAGDCGRLVYEHDRLTLTRNAVPTAEFSRTSQLLFAKSATTEEVFPFADHGGQHGAIMQNFVDAILDGAPLIAPAAEGLASLELANAMVLSTWTDRTIELPMDAAEYARELEGKIAEVARR